MSPEEFRKYEFDRSMREYWESRLAGDETGYQVITDTADRSGR